MDMDKELPPARTTVLEPDSELSAPEDEKDEVAFQDGGYGWVVVIAQMLITANTWGVNGSFGVYLDHYISTQAFPGTSAMAYAFIGGFSVAGQTMFTPLVTLSARTLGTKPTLAIGLVLEAGALVAASFATQAWHLFLTQGVVFGAGCCFIFVGTYGIIPQWFARRIGVAAGLASAGSGVGGLAHSLGSRAMISRFGLSWSFRITACCVAVVHALCILLIRERKQPQAHEQQQHMFDVRLFRRPAFLLIILWAFFSAIGYTIVLFSLPNNAVDIGATTQQAAMMAAMVNLGMGVGRPLVGFFSDYVGKVAMSGYATLLAGIWCLCLWTSAKTFPVLLAFSILSGCVIGTFWATMSSVLVETFGKKQLPTTLSVAMTMTAIPTLVAESMGLALRRPSQPTYLDVQVFAGCMFVAGSLCLAVLRLSPRMQSKTSAVPKS